VNKSKPDADRVNDHFRRLKDLLDIEAEEEKRRFEENLDDEQSLKSGVSLRSLEILEETAGLGGRHVLVLKKIGRGALPFTTLDSGSPVFLSYDQGAKKSLARGVVKERTELTLQVVFDEPPVDSEEGLALRIDLAFDESSRRRERHALDKAMKADKDRLAELREILLGVKAARFKEPSRGEFTALNSGLNDEQKEAVTHALRAEDVAIIHGPPGTGKTTTLVEIIRQAVRRGDKVLITAPSNLGVDNMIQKLASFGEKIVRIGHPARVMPELHSYTLDQQVEKHEDAKLARKMQKEAAGLFRLAHRYTRSPPPKGMKANLFQEARALINDARQLESQAIDRVLDSATIVAATLSGADSFVLSRRRFDLVVIDEAGQATEAASWIPLLKSQTVILAGDHQQLPPTVLSKAAMDGGYGQSMMERLNKMNEAVLTKRLDLQYRMHASIMNFSSQEFYENGLKAFEGVAARLLRDLKDVNDSEFSNHPVDFVDTAGAAYEEEIEADSGSRFNSKEADFVARKIEQLIKEGLKPEEIAVISPYAAQVRLLRERFPDSKLEIDTIDGFQGREKEAVLITLVRSNDDQDIGFLRETRRMNVAMTRAKRYLLMIGDSATLSSDPFFQRMISYMEEIGAYRSIWELAPELLES
jgi:ATP-dependent RNA/DNA helicase IGHMBP2